MGFQLFMWQHNLVSNVFDGLSRNSDGAPSFPNGCNIYRIPTATYIVRLKARMYFSYSTSLILECGATILGIIFIKCLCRNLHLKPFAFRSDSHEMPFYEQKRTHQWTNSKLYVLYETTYGRPPDVLRLFLSARYCCLVWGAICH